MTGKLTDGTEFRINITHTIQKFNIAGLGNRRDKRNGFTYVTLVNKATGEVLCDKATGMLIVGASECSAKDQYSRKYGRQLAFYRMASKINNTVDHRTVCDTYRKSCSSPSIPGLDIRIKVTGITRFQNAMDEAFKQMSEAFKSFTASYGKQSK